MQHCLIGKNTASLVGVPEVFLKIITNLKMKLKSQLLFLEWIVNKLTRGTYMQKASHAKLSLATIVKTLSITSKSSRKGIGNMVVVEIPSVHDDRHIPRAFGRPFEVGWLMCVYVQPPGSQIYPCKQSTDIAASSAKCTQHLCA